MIWFMLLLLSKNTLHIHSKVYFSKQIWRNIQKVKTHEETKAFKCRLCQKSFVNATNFKIHFRGVHEDTKDNKRNSCGKNFSLPENLKSHFKLFHECQKDHKCEICEKSFVRTRDLKGHIRAVHGEVRDDIECNICGKSVSNLSSHVKSVLVVKSFSLYLEVWKLIEKYTMTEIIIYKLPTITY